MEYFEHLTEEEIFSVIDASESLHDVRARGGQNSLENYGLVPNDRVSSAEARLVAVLQGILSFSEDDCTN